MFGLSACALLSPLNAMSQDLVSGSSLFTFKRPTASVSPKKKTIYQVKNRLSPRRRLVKSGAGISTQPTQPTLGSRKPVLSATTFAANEQLGITMWRLRPERTGDNGARLLTLKGSANNSSKMIAERVGFDTVFKMGEKVRISVESPRSGYLYIIDRELRKDDTVGEPYLIFPTLKTRGGDNKVSSGMVIEVPAQTDDPFYFDITPTEENYAGELLTVMVSPTKIKGLQLKNDAIKLSPDLVKAWEDHWERTATTLELETGSGLTYTAEEKEAGAGTRQLTQNSPSPQTLISVDVPKGKAFLISFPMKVSKQ